MKQMEGDNVARRARARQARAGGKLPSEQGVTLGASKAPERVPRKADHADRLNAREQGKQQPHRRTEPKK